MLTFEYTGFPARVLFGFDTTNAIGTELEKLGVTKALVLTTPFQASDGEELLNSLGEKAAGLFSNATMHTPVAVTNEAMSFYNKYGADGIISIGGGSTIGLGKAIALRNDAPQLVLPTTYAGSEMTSILGQTEDGLKSTLKSMKVLPEAVIYDVNKTLSLPLKMSVTSGMNAIAHAVEALYAENANPVLSLMAEEGIATLFKALPALTEDISDKQARYDALYGAWLCAICLGTGGVALHHKLCHVIGGSFDLPHAETHTIILPHAIAYNAPSIGPALERMKRAMANPSPAKALYDVTRKAGVPTSLRELGMPEDGINKAVEITLANPYWNPHPLEEDGIRKIIRAAWEGSASDL